METILYKPLFINP
jgi:hypothetical protein